MLIISFGWTWPALFANRPFLKLVTRRDWKESHARKFKEGMLVKGVHKDMRYGGKHVVTVRLTQDPYKEPLHKMPHDDYFAEGFAFLGLNPHMMPKSMPYDVSREGFKAWQDSDGEPWVVRFDIEEQTKTGFEMFTELKDTAPPLTPEIPEFGERLEEEGVK